MAYVLALDQGTTSSRALLFERDGQVRAAAQREFRQIFPQPGWVEHDPEEIWSSQRAVIDEVLAQARVAPRAIAAIGITNQRETTLLWERATGIPIANAIVWQDRRTAPMCERLRADGLEPLVRAKTGLVLDPYFSATKIRWLLDTVPGARARAEEGALCFGTVDSWLAWKLSAGRLHVTDASNAARTALFNIHTLQWDEELLQVFGVPPAILPEVCASSAVVGATAPSVLDPPVPIAGIAGDQQAALFGQACLDPGMAKNTYGTGCFLLLNTGTRPVISPHKLLATVAWNQNGRITYALEGSVFIGGAVVQWLRDGLGLGRSAAEIASLAATVEGTGGVYLVPAFAGLGAPHWDASARGLIAGLTRGTTAAHLARAALEGIAYQVADVLDAMQADADIPISELRVDGGAAASDLLLQFQADITGIPIVRAGVLEATALGAACLAGLAVGFWRDSAEVARFVAAGRRFEPQMPAADVERLRAGWQKALARAKAWEDA
ncbi:MAG: glycerol kinase GlpK [Defluviicoccus sp.]|nr:glycerol kinase GlpK [Defluviicoccus sp.]